MRGRGRAAVRRYAATVDVPDRPRTLGVVVTHNVDGAVTRLPAVRDLRPQVDGLVLVRNGSNSVGDGATAEDDTGIDVEPGTTVLAFPNNRGTARAWNAALSLARERGYRYLYLLDQDSVPSPGAVAAAVARIEVDGAAAVVQPPAPARTRLPVDPFPWNTAASGSLYDVAAVEAVGGFDERLFVDEVDHELLARMVGDGRPVAVLDTPTVDHRAGRPRQVSILGRTATVSGHDSGRRRLQGFSAGVLVRRYATEAPPTASRLLVRHLVNAAKDALTGDRTGAGALLCGLGAGVATSRPPLSAADRPCPYCEGPLVGRFGQVPDWRYGTGAPADVYGCPDCGALAAGRSPDPDELLSWYSEYYTHGVDPARPHIWSRLWPTPRRRREMAELRWYLTPPAPPGRMLDVGTGSGERLVQFAEAGWDVVGQDLDAKAGWLARDRGLDVHDCPVEDLVGREEPFDLVAMSHVLEHAVDPVALLDACIALLRPGGRLCVICPNAESLGRRLFGRWWFGLEQPRHLGIPTLRSLQSAARRLDLHVDRAAGVATDAAVILGGSLVRTLETRLPPGRLRRGARFATAFAGQALGRAATLVDHRLGEEVVWVVRVAHG